MADHLVAEQVCTVCGLSYHRKPLPYWLTVCPGARIYHYGVVPWEQLATRTQLAREGLRLAPGATPAGCYIAWKREAVILLYDRSAAHPKRELSAKQRATLDKAKAALAASRTCTACGRLVPSRRHLAVLGESADAGERLCSDCVRDRAHEAEREMDRAGVYATAARWLAEDATGERPLRVLDTETTGLGSTDEVIELAILDAGGTALVYSLLAPSVPIGEGAAAVNGFTEEDLRGAPRLGKVWPQVCAALRGEGARVVTYNRDFDWRLLAQSAERYGLEGIPGREWGQWECLMDLCTGLDTREDGRSGRWWVSLGEVCWWLGIPAGGHRARGDAEAALAVLRELARRHFLV